MKILSCFIFLYSINALATSSSELQSVTFNVFETNSMSSENELRASCNAYETETKSNLTKISLRLSGSESTFRVKGFYGWTGTSPTFPTRPDAGTAYYCYLNFSSADSSYSFKPSSFPGYSHLSAANWDTACKPEYDQASANLNSPITLYSKSWSLFQGRTCDVSSIEVLRLKLVQ